ncbi:corticoliberin-like [Myripristis murdjan]|uniref:corticoliberin-like n=1 Tax=Myripristis murdjan TaxID=586833 RepID=UPI0011762E06|nr:corticoliberin-like [Myripristis murdjan]
MKLGVLLWAAALLGAFLPRCEARPAESPAAARAPDSLPRPLLLRLGEEFFLRLGGAAPPPAPAPAAELAAPRALLLTQRLLRGEDAGELSRLLERGRRSEEPPISLDLTFHLLREVLEMARAEQIAQQADSNRKIMDSFGK